MAKIDSLSAMPVAAPDPFMEFSPVDDILNRAREISGSPKQAEQYHYLDLQTGLSPNLASMAEVYSWPIAQIVALTEDVIPQPTTTPNL